MNDPFQSPHPRHRSGGKPGSSHHATIEYRILVGEVVFRAESLDEALEAVDTLKHAAPHVDVVLQRRQVVSSSWEPMYGKD